MKKHAALFGFLTICITLACSVFSPKTQSQPNGTAPTAITESEQQNSESPIILDIYEFKEGFLQSDTLIPSGNGWKPYHVRFNISANTSIANLGFLDQHQEGNGFANYPHIVTTDGHTYGNTSETLFNMSVYAPPLGTYGFPGIPLNSYIGPISGNYRTVGIDFSVPEKLTPQKLVFPFLGYSIDLPPLGTEKSSEISIKTNQIIDFPGNVAVDPNINIEVSDFIKTDSEITINYQIINNNVAENQWGFYYVALVDSYGFFSKEVVGTSSECKTMYLSNEDVIVGPGQTKTGTLCFRKNPENNPSFYILYFTDNQTAGPDNKAILIKP